MRRAAELLSAALLFTGTPALSQEAPEGPQSEPLTLAAAEAQQQLRQTFTNLSFEDFGPAPVKGPLYQATAGGRIIYFAPGFVAAAWVGFGSTTIPGWTFC